ncbi:hypothetical protein B0H13DRAFT_2665417 [Mycena leptocephala]|nr:hypothetical protein B0H13DRAFT_2665417 [Mycena leptocephala]
MVWWISDAEYTGDSPFSLPSPYPLPTSIPDPSFLRLNLPRPPRTRTHSFPRCRLACRCEGGNRVGMMSICAPCLRVRAAHRATWPDRMRDLPRTMAGERRWWGPVVRRALPAVCRVRIGTKDGEGTRASPIADATSGRGGTSRVEGRGQAPQAVTYLKSRAVGTRPVHPLLQVPPAQVSDLRLFIAGSLYADRPSMQLPPHFTRPLRVHHLHIFPPVPLLGRTLLPFPTSPAPPVPAYLWRASFHPLGGEVDSVAVLPPRFPFSAFCLFSITTYNISACVSYCIK